MIVQLGGLGEKLCSRKFFPFRLEFITANTPVCCRPLFHAEWSLVFCTTSKPPLKLVGAPLDPFYLSMCLVCGAQEEFLSPKIL